MFALLARTAVRSSALARRHLTKFSKDHEWVKIDQGVGTVGITNYAQSALGDIVYVEIPKAGEEVTPEEPVGVVESVKSTSDIFSPLSGTIVEANPAVLENSKILNKLPETDGWLFKVKISNPAEIEELLDLAAYKKLTEDEDH
ncbi:glycine cleavage system H-protein subunit [Coemansia nantahalensis]|uniref:Glycine cleavage system H-protein subunit n=2 Tax=Coemansia TaxID=4863 RepID=A0ACC1L292_9FUNG|nr:glycine cleavage system H-protein subunit [Coemansia nantahalensis]KAJ2799468.1 glycine cleavage system H-protein subunit [Coemansia helicoidea]